MKKITTALAVFAFVVSAQSTLAADRARSPRTDQLRSAQQALAWRAQNTKGTHSQHLNSEARKLDRLIDDLEQGRSVDPREIDEALDNAQRGF